MSAQPYDPADLVSTLFDQSSDALLLFDLESEQILDANAVAERLIGSKRTELRGRKLGDVMSAENPEAWLRLRAELRADAGFRLAQARVAVSLAHLPNAHTCLLTARTAPREPLDTDLHRELIETQRRFEAFMNTTPLASFIIDEHGRLVYVNQTMCEKLAQTQEQLLGKSAHDFYAPEIADKLRANDARVMAAGKPIELRESVPTPDGIMREWWGVKFPFRDSQGRNLMGGIALDVTERRQTEEALQRSEERYRSLWQRNLAGIVRASVTGRILDCNDSFARLFGYQSREDMLTRSARELYFDLGVREEFLNRLRQAGSLTNYELRMRRADGASIWVLENVSLLVENGEEILEGTLIDISDRKRMETALRASEATYRTLVNHLDQAIFLKDRELRYITANHVFCTGVGKSENELRGKTIAELFEPNPLTDKSREIEKRVLQEGKTLEAEEVLRLQGRQRMVRIYRTPVRSPDGAIVGVLGICWDVTDQRSLETQLRHVHKMDAIGQLAGGIAHDFNNLLTIMLGNLSFALKETTDLSTVLEMVRNAEKAGLRAAELTKTLLGFSRQAALATAPIDLHQVIDEVLTLTRSTLPANITLEVKRQTAPWLVHADPGSIHQVLTNLTLNARDAMPQGGKISYEVSHFAPEADYLARHVEARAGEFVRLRVADTGVGIPNEAKQRIFEPFFTTKDKAKGTGLGLAIVFSIIKQHHGWIVCDSEPGRGATFDIFLPRWHAGAAAVVEPVPAPPVKNPLILLVDDEKMIRMLTQTILGKAGFEVVMAENGESAIELFRARHAEISLVILDAVMPRLSGRDTLRVLASINSSVPVLFSSGYSTEQVDVNEFPQVRGFLAKPYRAEQLVQKVNEIVRH